MTDNNKNNSCRVSSRGKKVINTFYLVRKLMKIRRLNLNGNKPTSYIHILNEYNRDSRHRQITLFKLDQRSWAHRGNFYLEF